MPDASEYRKKIKSKVDQIKDEKLLNWVNILLDKMGSLEDVKRHLDTLPKRSDRAIPRLEKKATYYRENINVKHFPSSPEDGEEDLPKLVENLINDIEKLENELATI